MAFFNEIVGVCFPFIMYSWDNEMGFYILAQRSGWIKFDLKSHNQYLTGKLGSLNDKKKWKQILIIFSVINNCCKQSIPKT